MFAGAAREAVFSNPDVIARINKNFIPVALKAARVANPPEGIEGDLLRELKRTQPAPQGICVMNSVGKVLAWSLMFEDDDATSGFFDHAVARYKEFPDAAKPVSTERFHRYPKHKMDDVADNGMKHEIPEAHGEHQKCPGDLGVKEGSVVARVVGRAIGDDGAPLSDARKQDNYIEDWFEITPAMQQRLARTATEADGEAFPLPRKFARKIVANAYLGMLDVSPLGGNNVQSKTTLEEIHLWAQRADDGSLQLWGMSDVAGGPTDRSTRVDGRKWGNAIELAWTGRLELAGERIRALAIVAEGKERLYWGHGAADGNDVAHLPSGRPVDFKGRVRYGMAVRK